jgi:hypothetical protein
VRLWTLDGKLTSLLSFRWGRFRLRGTARLLGLDSTMPLEGGYVCVTMWRSSPVYPISERPLLSLMLPSLAPTSTDDWNAVSWPG